MNNTNTNPRDKSFAQEVEKDTSLESVKFGALETSKS